MKPTTQSILRKLNEEKLYTTAFYLMKELGVSYSEFCDMPVAAIIVLSKELEKHKKREEKEYRKAKRKR